MSKTREKYNEYLKSDRWRELSSEVRHERGNRCEFCMIKAGFSILHCHHMTYERFGSEEKEDLLILCEYHHSFYHSQFPSAIMPRLPVDKLKAHVFEVLRKCPKRGSTTKAKKKSVKAKAKRHAAALEEAKEESKKGLAEYMKRTSRKLDGRVSDRSAEIAAFRERQAEAERIRKVNESLERIRNAELKKQRQQAQAAANAKKSQKPSAAVVKSPSQQEKKPAWQKRKERRERKALKRKRKREWESAKNRALANVIYVNPD